MDAGNQLGSVPVCSTPSRCVWQSVGGTSEAAIALAGAIAAEEELKPLLGGNLGPAIYAKATEGEGTLFIDVTKGDNELFSSQCCRAEDGFDLASGWGVPNLAQLAHGS